MGFEFFCQVQVRVGFWVPDADISLAVGEDYYTTKGKGSKNIIITDKFAGYILANGCSLRRKIESDSKATIYISGDPGSSERSLHISGTPEQIQKAQYLLQYPKRDIDEETIHLEIPSRMAGAIIGIGGSKLQQMEFESKARIMINQDHPFQDSKKRVLTISGTREQVKKAQSLLPPCATVSNPQDSRPLAKEGNCHPHKKKSLPVLKWN